MNPPLWVTGRKAFPLGKLLPHKILVIWPCIHDADVNGCKKKLS